MSSYDILRAALDAADTPPAALLQMAQVVHGNILRGDMMIGIMPPEAFQAMHDAYRRAGEGGVVEAWIELGDIYASGCNDLVNPAHWAAQEAYRKAAAAGSREAALKVVSHAYFHMRDEAELADDIGARALALLDGDEDGRAHLYAGYCAYAGFGMPKDDAVSLRLHRAAAERGNADAMFELYVLYSTGQGAEKDEAEALKWCRAAAETGHPRACYNLGAFYATGRGVDKDPAQARAWYERASDAGHGRASAMLGYMCLAGDGGAANPVEAQKWLARAESQGFDVDEFLAQLGLERPRDPGERAAKKPTRKSKPITKKKPAATKKKPSATKKKPAATKKKPAATKKKPSATKKKPSATKKKPAKRPKR